MMVDVVSKNGIFLLNIPPKADGSFPKEVINNLKEVGAWLDKNGEAIYGTSPWFIYGEGPNEIPVENYNFHHNNYFAQIKYTASDIRFTTRGKYIYAICLGNPGENIQIKAPNNAFKLRDGDILKVTHLGSGQTVEYTHSKTALELLLKDINLDGKANVFKIDLSY